MLSRDPPLSIFSPLFGNFSFKEKYDQKERKKKTTFYAQYVILLHPCALQSASHNDAMQNVNRNDPLFFTGFDTHTHTVTSSNPCENLQPNGSAIFTNKNVVEIISKEIRQLKKLLLPNERPMQKNILYFSLFLP